MNAEKAKEILGYVLEERPQSTHDDGVEALKLGIEALKDQCSMRIIGVLPEDYLLPSETKE